MEPVGLALGTLGISGLFVSCIQNFNIIVQTKTFSKDFDLLCTELASLRLRLQTWGEAMGIVSSPGEEPLPSSVILDRPDVSATFKDILLHLCRLLEEAGGVAGRYTVVDQAPLRAGRSTMILHSSKGMETFSDAFASFKTRLKRAQKQTSAWKLIRWAVHDLENFKDIIDKITRLLDSLEKATESLDRGIVRRRQNAIMTREVESISDTQSLRLLQDLALSTHASSASQRLISDVASTHLTQIVESNLSGSSRSYRTAPTHPESHRSRSPERAMNVALRSAVANAALPLRPLNQQSPTGPDNTEEKTEEKATQDAIQRLGLETPQEQTSQNRLIMEQALRKQKAPVPELSFASGSAAYGQAITEVKKSHAKVWEAASQSLVIQASDENELARRVFVELRSIRRAEIPFISAAPLEDRLDIILASIEGPPDTPYEKGIFWVFVRFDADAPTKPPRLRFFTKVYHPNIDCEGQVCAQYPELSNVSASLYGKRPETHHWFAGETPARFYVGALLTALCNLLASPNIEDPLVLEIAETYIADHEAFVRNARHYTRKYATNGRPEAEAISTFIATWDERLYPGESLMRSHLALANTARGAASTSLQRWNDGASTSILPSDQPGNPDYTETHDSEAWKTQKLGKEKIWEEAREVEKVLKDQLDRNARKILEANLDVWKEAREAREVRIAREARMACETFDPMALETWNGHATIQSSSASEDWDLWGKIKVLNTLKAIEVLDVLEAKATESQGFLHILESQESEALKFMGIEARKSSEARDSLGFQQKNISTSEKSDFRKAWEAWEAQKTEMQEARRFCSSQAQELLKAQRDWEAYEFQEISEAWKKQQEGLKANQTLESKSETGEASDIEKAWTILWMRNIRFLKARKTLRERKVLQFSKRPEAPTEDEEAQR